jgi:hypothetical protein
MRRDSRAFAEIVYKVIELGIALATGRTLAAGFVGKEFKKAFYYVYNAPAVVKGYDGAGAHRQTVLFHICKVELDIQHVGGYTTSRSTAYLNHFKFALVGYTLAYIVYDISERYAERYLEYAFVDDIAGQAYKLGAGAIVGAYRAKCLAAI